MSSVLGVLCQELGTETKYVFIISQYLRWHLLKDYMQSPIFPKVEHMYTYILHENFYFLKLFKEMDFLAVMRTVPPKK